MIFGATTVKVVYTPFKREQEQLLQICISIIWLSSFFVNVVIAWECWTQDFTESNDENDDECEPTWVAAVLSRQSPKNALQ
jgi:hypothetical protein